MPPGHSAETLELPPQEDWSVPSIAIFCQQVRTFLFGIPQVTIVGPPPLLRYVGTSYPIKLFMTFDLYLQDTCPTTFHSFTHMNKASQDPCKASQDPIHINSLLWLPPYITACLRIKSHTEECDINTGSKRLLSFTPSKLKNVCLTCIALGRDQKKLKSSQKGLYKLKTIEGIKQNTIKMKSQGRFVFLKRRVIAKYWKPSEFLTLHFWYFQAMANRYGRKLDLSVESRQSETKMSYFYEM